VQVPPLRLRTRSAVYRRLAKLLREHYAHPRDLYRLREFTGYFAKNYKFGHTLWKGVQNAPDVRVARTLARDFFARQEDAGERLPGVRPPGTPPACGSAAAGAAPVAPGTRGTSGSGARRRPRLPPGSAWSPPGFSRGSPGASTAG